ncbi:uncharacterized protein METZ01_LOCUS357824, partial [marine metagenome]
MTAPDEGLGMGGPGDQFPDDMPEEMRDLQPTSFEFDEATGCESVTFEDGSTGTRCRNEDGSFTNTFTGADGETEAWEEPGFQDPMMMGRRSPDEPMRPEEAARFGNFEGGMRPGDFMDEMMPGGLDMPDEMRDKIPAIVMFDPETGCEEVIFEDGTTSSRCMNQDGTFTNVFVDESGEVQEWEEEPPPMMQRRMPTDMGGGGMGGMGQGEGMGMGPSGGPGGCPPDGTIDEATNTCSFADPEGNTITIDMSTGQGTVTLPDGTVEPFEMDGPGMGMGEGMGMG